VDQARWWRPWPAQSSDAEVASQPAPAQLLTKLSEAELDQTVEQFLRAQCQQRVASLKRHIGDLAANFEASAKSARQKLQDVKEQQQKEDDEPPPASDEPSASASTAEPAPAPEQSPCDPFALVCTNGAFVGRIVRFEPTDEKRSWTIGRVEECDVCLQGDDEVSSKHAKIVFDRKQFKLADTGSTNGTFVGGDGKKSRKLVKNKNHVLKTEHLITIGGCTYRWAFFADAETLAAHVVQLAREAGN